MVRKRSFPGSRNHGMLSLLGFCASALRVEHFTSTYFSLHTHTYTHTHTQEEDVEISFETSKGVKVVSSFDSMGLKEELLRGLYAYGFEKPSAIQQRAVLPIVMGRDVIAQAQSGTGKSALIAITTCQMMDITMRE